MINNWYRDPVQGSIDSIGMIPDLGGIGAAIRGVTKAGKVGSKAGRVANMATKATTKTEEVKLDIELKGVKAKLQTARVALMSTSLKKTGKTDFAHLRTCLRSFVKKYPKYSEEITVIRQILTKEQETLQSNNSTSFLL